MKSYKIKYNVSTYVLISLCIILSAVGVVWNIFNIAYFYGFAPERVFSYALICVFSFLIFILSVSVLFFSKYLFKNDSLTVRFGLFYNKCNVNEIVEITHFKKSNKLVMYFKDQTYSVILISDTEYNDFILTAREFNSNIFYDNKIDGEDTPE